MDEPSLEALITYPGEWWNEPYGQSEREMKRQILSELSDAEILTLSDSDTDGLGCIAVIENAFPNKNVARIPSGHGADFEALEALELIHKNGNYTQDLYFMDISPNEETWKSLLSEMACHEGEVHIFDHHEWEAEMEERFEDVADVFDVRSSEDVCAANIAFDNVEEQLKETVSDTMYSQMEELVSVTRDHDIWVKEDSRSDDLADFQFEVDEFEYVEAVSKYGIELLEQDDVVTLIEEARFEKNRRIEGAVKFADWVRVIRTETGEVFVLDEDTSLENVYPPAKSQEDCVDVEITVALAYGNAYSSGLGNTLVEGWASWYDIPDEEQDEWTYEELEPSLDYKSDKFRPGDADVAVIIPPWNKVSFRSSEEYPICDVLASELNGGGHKKAAGGTPNIAGKDNPITYGVHWETKGQMVKEKIKQTFSELLENEELFARVEEDNDEQASENLADSKKTPA